MTPASLTSGEGVGGNLRRRAAVGQVRPALTIEHFNLRPALRLVALAATLGGCSTPRGTLDLPPPPEPSAPEPPSLPACKPGLGETPVVLFGEAVLVRMPDGIDLSELSDTEASSRPHDGRRCKSPVEAVHVDVSGTMASTRIQADLKAAEAKLSARGFAQAVESQRLVNHPTQIVVKYSFVTGGGKTARVLLAVLRRDERTFVLSYVVDPTGFDLVLGALLDSANSLLIIPDARP